tara:strand:+ start:1534 stop:2010 length:477 start_codon:yes stop_codon:yes gene_type:complete
MNQLFGVSLAFIVALILWGLGKKPLNHKKPSKDLSQAFQSNPELVQSFTKSKLALPTATNIDKRRLWTAPSNTLEKLNLKKFLFRSINLGPKERLLAVQIAGQWGDKSILSVIKRGLKDSDSNVMKEAAIAIEKYKRVRPNDIPRKAHLLPLNVARMR